MLCRPSWYKKIKQQTFENNSNRFRTNLDSFIGVFRLPSSNNNESCHLFDLRYAAPSSSDFRRCPLPPQACELNLRQCLRYSLLFSFPTCLCFFQLKFFMILNSIYLKAVKNSYQKNTYKKLRPNFLMFLDHGVSRDQNKS